MNLDVLLSNAVDRHRDRIAVGDARRRFSYAEVDRRLNRLGQALLALGLGRQDRIASLQQNSIETFEVDLAAARFGFVRTLLNWRQTADDHAYVIDHAEAKVLVFGGQFVELVAGLRERLPLVRHYICVADGAGPVPDWAHDYDALLAGAAETPPRYPVGEQDWHSIYYTSGTTGKPKGVVLSQRNWLVLVRNHLVDPFREVTSDDVLLHAAPMSHASGAFLIAHFVRGARQFIVPRFDAGEVLAAIERERVTTSFLAPTMILMLLEHPDHAKTDKSSLRNVVYGGAPMAAEHVRTVCREWGYVLSQGYGQWEAPQLMVAMNQAQHRIALEEGKEHRLASAGLPLSFCRIAVMDDEGNLLPTGAEGEIVTAGDHLMVGYLKNPEATAAERVGEWQRSGDVGRIDADGFVYLTDRKKDLIISGGNNIYPRVLEEVLHTHPAVHECIVVGVPDARWGELVHAVVIRRKGAELEADAFLAWCRDRLPGDKRPRSVEFVDELPKSNYGKILRREVRARYWSGRGRSI